MSDHMDPAGEPDPTDEIPDDYHIVVSSFADVDVARRLSGQEKQRVADLFSSTSWDHVVWFPDWLLEDDDKDIETVEASDHLAVGTCKDYSEKAVQFSQPHRDGAGGYAPKQSIVWFERGPSLETLETPQKGLTDF